MLTDISGNSPNSSEANWSPNNLKIVYSSDRAFDGSDNTNFFETTNIWVINADGTNDMPLTQIGADQANSFNPQWSPDGTKIAFESSRALNGGDANIDVSNIWVMDADGGNPTPLTNNEASGADNYEPKWSPDGTQILFIASKNLDPMIDAENNAGVNNVWVMNADGSNQTPLTLLTASGSSSSESKWSPDGSRIVYGSSRSLNPAEDMPNTNNTPNVWVMNADGSGATALTDYETVSLFTSNPSFSSDGLKVVFFSNGKLDGSDARTDDGSRNIWIIDADGQNLEPLTFYSNAAVSAVFAQDPIFSADGSKIAYRCSGALDGSNASTGINNDNIFIMNPDGTGFQPLTTNIQADTTSFDPSFVNQP